MHNQEQRMKVLTLHIHQEIHSDQLVQVLQFLGAVINQIENKNNGTKLLVM